MLYSTDKKNIRTVFWLNLFMISWYKMDLGQEDHHPDSSVPPQYNRPLAMQPEPIHAGAGLPGRTECCDMGYVEGRNSSGEINWNLHRTPVSASALKT
jgi:hypothetical protein